MAKVQGRAGRLSIYVILALLIVGLIGFGTDNFGGGARSVASVGDRDVSAEAYARALQAELRRAQAATGQPVTMSDLRAQGRDAAILGALLSQAALDGEADALGVSASDERVRDMLLAFPAFQGPSGFSDEVYRSALGRTGLSEAEFEGEIRDEAARELLLGAVSGAATPPEAYREAVLTYIGETRRVSYALIGEEALEAPIAEPSEEELAAWFAENAEAFTRPEAREVTYAILRPGALTDEVEVAEEAIQALYDGRSHEFVRPERRLVERLVFPDEEAAAAAAARLDAGEVTFDALVEERGLTPGDVDLGDATRDALGAAADAVFALEEPGVAGPAPTGLGPALFRVNAVLPASATPLEDVRDALREELALGEAERLVDERATEIDDLLAGGATVEELAELGLDVGTATIDAETTQGPAADPAFRDAALSAEEGDFPELRDLAEGGIFALRVDAVTPPRVPELAEVREEAGAAWRDARLRERLAERAEGLAETFAEGGEIPAEVETVEALRRDGVVEGAPDRFAQGAFEAEVGDVAVVHGLPAALLRVEEASPPDPEEARNALIAAALDAQLQQGLAEDLLAAYVRSIQAERGIGRDQGSVQAVLNQFN
jgi:peptidyl-prolyl cis-trans isomerase D